MKNIHLFETASAFTEAYTGAQYSEPWVSYTRENTDVKYNKNYDIIANAEGIADATIISSRITCSDLEDHTNVFSLLLNGEDYTIEYCNLGDGYYWNVLGEQESHRYLECYDDTLYIRVKSK